MAEHSSGEPESNDAPEPVEELGELGSYNPSNPIPGHLFTQKRKPILSLDEDDSEEDALFSEESEIEGKEEVEEPIYINELDPEVLVFYRRELVMWVLASCGVLAGALLIPTSPWFFGLLKVLLMLIAGGVGVVRLFQMNAVNQELEKYQEHVEEKVDAEVKEEAEEEQE